MSQKTKSTFVLAHPSEILQALVGLKDVRVVQYERDGRDVYLMIEQVIEAVSCETCGNRAQVKDRPVVHYVDLPVYGAPMHLSWKKHRMRCVDVVCPTKTWVLSDHRIAAKGCLLTTRAAKWATVQVGNGRTVSEVAKELDCDWHTVNDAVTVGASVAPTITSFTPTSGPPGTKVVIKGMNLSGATSVTFNGTTASINKDAATKMKVTVPTGATTGMIKVTTPDGSVTSAKKFKVT